MNMKYTKEVLEEIVAKSTCFSDVARHFGKRANGGSISHIIKTIKKFEISTSHFLSMSELCKRRGPNSNSHKKHYSEVLVLRTKDYKESWQRLRRAMTEYGFEYCCQKCKVSNLWKNELLVLEIDHINGNSMDNRPENLRFMCPNCHSQTKTYCRKKTIVLHSSVKFKEKIICLDCNKNINKKAIRCKSCASIFRTKDSCRRPNKEILLQDVESMPMTKVGKKYGVSDNAVRKWVKFYEKQNSI